MDISPRQTLAAGPPFDAAKLDRLMEEAGIDVLLATSKHNTQYLLGGYKFIFFAAMDAIGHSRYLPIVVYEKGSPITRRILATAWKGRTSEQPFLDTRRSYGDMGYARRSSACGRAPEEDRKGGCSRRHRTVLPAR